MSQAAAPQPDPTSVVSSIVLKISPLNDYAIISLTTYDNEVVVKTCNLAKAHGYVLSGSGKNQNLFIRNWILIPVIRKDSEPNLKVELARVRTFCEGNELAFSEIMLQKLNND